VFISVAAVADYRVKNPSAQKIKKANGHLSLELEENPDILAWVAAQPKLPLIVGNLAQDALGRDDSAITLYDADGEHPLGRGPKLELARKLLEHVATRLSAKK